MFKRGFKRSSYPDTLEFFKLLEKRKRIFEKSKTSPNYLDNEYFVDLEFNSKQIKEVDRIMRDLRVETIYRDPVKQKIKYSDKLRMSSFKDKPLKKCHTDNRKMIDCIHDDLIKNMDKIIKN